MEESFAGGLLPVNIARIRESLDSLAGDIDFIVSGQADDPRDTDAWEHRENAGLQLLRLRAALHNGEVDWADCTLDSLTTLRRVWHAIKALKYGSHHDQPATYCGPLFLPDEIGPLSEGLPVRKADEPYDPNPELRPTRERIAEMLRGRKENADSSEIADERTTAILSRAAETQLTTKWKRWGNLPSELRALSARLADLEPETTADRTDEGRSKMPRDVLVNPAQLISVLDECRQALSNLAHTRDNASPKWLAAHARRTAVKATRAIVAAADNKFGEWGDLPHILQWHRDPNREPAHFRTEAKDGQVWEAKVLEIKLGTGFNADGSLPDDTALSFWLLLVGPMFRSRTKLLASDAGSFDFRAWTADDIAFPVERLRAQAADWADCCRVAAEIVRASARDDASPGVLVSTESRCIMADSQQFDPAAELEVIASKLDEHLNNSGPTFWQRERNAAGVVMVRAFDCGLFPANMRNAIAGAIGKIVPDAPAHVLGGYVFTAIEALLGRAPTHGGTTTYDPSTIAETVRLVAAKLDTPERRRMLPDGAAKHASRQGCDAGEESRPADRDHQLVGVAVNIVEMQAEIQREWEKHFAQPFPGWSREAIAGVAAYAKLPADDVDNESPFIVYQKAIAKKSNSGNEGGETDDDPPAAVHSPDFRSVGGHGEAADDPQSTASRALEELLGDEAKPILNAARSDKSADDRMRAICGIDRRLLHWKSTQWANLLSLKERITPDAIRQTSFWKVDRKRAIEAERRLRENIDA
jgi:hypothetical protein